MAVLVLRTCLLLGSLVLYKLTFGTLLKSIKFVRQLAIGYGLVALIWGHFLVQAALFAYCFGLSFFAKPGLHEAIPS